MRLREGAETKKTGFSRRDEGSELEEGGQAEEPRGKVEASRMERVAPSAPTARGSALTLMSQCMHLLSGYQSQPLGILSLNK